ATMTRLSQHRLSELVAEQLVSIDNLEELDAKQVSAAMFTIKFAQDAQLQADKLSKAKELADARIAKLEADIQRSNADLELKVKKLEQMQATVDREIEARKLKGGSSTQLTADDIIEVRKALFGDAA